jgi:hypothetical protein
MSIAIRRNEQSDSPQNRRVSHTLNLARKNEDRDRPVPLPAKRHRTPPGGFRQWCPLTGGLGLRKPRRTGPFWLKTIPHLGKSWSHVSHDQGNDGGSHEKAIRTERCCRIRADRCRFRPESFRTKLSEPAGSSNHPKGHERSYRAGRMDFTKLPRRNILGLY